MFTGELTTLLGDAAKDDPVGRIVRLLRERGGLSAAEIARTTGLAKSTVSSALGELRQSGMVVDAVEQGAGRTARAGRPATAVTLNPRAALCFGVQIAPNLLRVIAADISHAILAEESVEMPLDYSPAMAAKATRRIVDELARRAGASRGAWLGIGLAVPAPVRPDTGQVLRASMVPTWAGVDIRRAFAPEFDIPIFADNESNCAAIAEMMWGAAIGQDDFIFYKVDIGIGGAIVLNRRVLTGIDGGAGEFGHVTLNPTGDLCFCGNRGCLELYAGFRSVLKLASERFGSDIPMERFIELAKDGDIGCRRLIQDAAQFAGQGLAMIGAIFNPPLIVVGGHGTAAGDILFDPLIQSYERHTLIKSHDLPEAARTRIVAGRFAGNDSSLGAVGLVLKHHGRLAETNGDRALDRP